MASQISDFLATTESVRRIGGWHAATVNELRVLGAMAPDPRLRVRANKELELRGRLEREARDREESNQ